MIQLPPDFKDFLKLLHAHEVQYLVIGGYAVNYYGYSRATADLDVWIALDPENANRLEVVLREFGFPQATSGLFLQPGSVIRMGVPPIRLEILTTISGVEFDNCFPRRIMAELDGIPINFIAIDDLRQNKAAAGRLKDRMDLGSLPA